MEQKSQISEMQQEQQPTTRKPWLTPAVQELTMDRTQNGFGAAVDGATTSAAHS